MEKEKSTEKQKPLNDYLRYSGFGIQMMVTIGLAAWGGVKLDGYFGLKVPVFLIVLTLSAIGGSLFIFIRQVTGKQS
ncbi:MAG TPA: AtpZ/AtpI family protein [Cytophagaceae bacterium]|nr:AtpZ/AtpI family protein [Cytophagaceae bacterium]